MVFPVFTNGTLISPSYMEFFKKHLNMVPVISIEGTALGTDERRGTGVFKHAMQSMEMLKEEDLFFGTSITVTTENYHYVTSHEFIEKLRSYGCKIVFYVEYVPTEAGTEHLACVAMPMLTSFSSPSLAMRRHLAVALHQDAASSTLVPTDRQNLVHSHPSATATSPQWVCARHSCRPCSVKFVQPRHSDGSTLAAVPSLNIGRK